MEKFGKEELIKERKIIYKKKNWFDWLIYCIRNPMKN